MVFRTEIYQPQQIENRIDYKSNLFLLGSCFSENMGDKLNYFQFNTVQNPFGILFHPFAIEKFIANTINKRLFTAKDLVYNNEQWHCWYAHSSVSNSDKSKLLSSLNNTVFTAHTQFSMATHVVITLGTSWVYRFVDEDILVANCHKVSQKKFVKELFSISELTASLSSIINLLKGVNKNVQILFSVSPIRHLKDGFIENSQSKAHLISAIHSVVKENKNVSYFPSYEILLDDLRDYRFYKKDMIHPNEIAINYIWTKFTKTWFSESTKPIMEEIDSIKKGLLHKPFNLNSLAHQKFLKNLAVKKETFLAKYPYINF